MILLLSLVATAAPDRPCATPMTWAAIVAPEPALPPPPDGLGLRDPYAVPNVRTSEHFAVRWGNQRRIADASVDRLLAAFEDAWAIEIEEMAHTRPFGSDEYYFNVYIGDSGNGAPPGYGAGGYYSPDIDGWPMVVVGADTLSSPEFADITAAHEFYHVIQGATRRFDYDPAGPAAWFWEATATWASAVVYPDNPSYATFLAGYAFLPHKRLNFFDYPDTGALQEYYQYGAFIFPLHVTDRLDTWEPVRDTWEDPGSNPDPIEVMRDAVASQGADLDALWLDHIARNTTWDYPDGNVYREVIAAWGHFSESRNLTAATLPAQGTDGAVDSPRSLPLERYGSHALVLNSPLDGTYTLRIDGDALGTEGGAAVWGATAVVKRPTLDPEYVPVVFDGAVGELVLDDVGDASKVYVALGVWTAGSSPRWGVETFAYRYQLAFTPVPVDEEPDPDERVRSCGCSASGSSAAWLVVPLLALAARRRRSHKM